MSAHSHADQAALALGLVGGNVPLTKALEVGSEIAQFLDGKVTLHEGIVTLLVTYYLIHFDHDVADLKVPEKRQEIIKQIQWFCEEGSVALGMILNEKIISEGEDRRQKH